MIKTKRLFPLGLCLAIMAAAFSQPLRAQIFVSVPSADAILQFSPNGGPPTVFASGLSLPGGLAFDAAGYLHVANSGNHTITRFPAIPTPGSSQAGVTHVPAGSGLFTPTAIAFGSAGALFVANGGSSMIRTYSPDAVFASSGLNIPYGLAFDAAGNLYAANRGDNTIEIFSPSGSPSVFATGVTGLRDLAWKSGVLYVAADGSNPVLEFATGGSAGSQLPGTFAGVGHQRGLAFDCDGNLYVAASPGSLSKFDSSGALLWTETISAGTPSYVAVQKNCALPQIAVDGLSVFIVDGDTSPTGGDNTHFGSLAACSATPKTHSFRVWNYGAGPLTVTNITSSNPAEFAVSGSFPLVVAGGGGWASFTVSFAPAGPGARSATISLENNDSSAHPFDFLVEGSGILAPLTMICPADKTVVCGETWTFDPPVSGSAGGPGPAITVASTLTNSLCPLVITRAWLATDACGNTSACSQTVTVAPALASPSPSGPAVISGPIHNPSNGHYYYLLEEDTWTASEAQAVALGGHLATVRNQAENDWIYAQFSQFGGTNRGLWIGLSDANSVPDGGFGYWANGEPVSYLNWGAGEPVNQDGLDDYVHLFWPGDPRASQWNDQWDIIGTQFGSIPINGVVEVSNFPPLLACATNKTVACGTPWDFDAPSASDPCSGADVAVTVVNTLTNSLCPLVVTRTWLAADACGNTNSCSQTVTVTDNVPPVFECASPSVAAFSAGTVDDDFAGAEPASASPGLLLRLQAAGAASLKGFDDCTINTFFGHTFTNLPPCITGATLRVRFRACGSSLNDNDTFGLSFTAPSGSLMGASWGRFLGSGNATAGLFNIGWNGGTVQEVTLDLSQLPNADGTTANLIADLNTHRFLDLVQQDDTSIDFAVLTVTRCCDTASKTVECGSNWTFDPPVATDGCSGTNVTLSVLSTVASGSCPQVITRTWVASDLCGNTNIFSQSVTVADNTPPVLTCATNKTVPCGKAWEFDAPTASDNCGGAAGPAPVAVSILSTTTNGVCPLVVTRTWQAVDQCGNTSTCSQTVTVNNDGPPLISCPPDKIVACGTSWSFDVPKATDACGGTNVTVTVLNTVTNGICPVVITRVWQATDSCGNTSVCRQSVTVEDRTPPVFVSSFGPILDQLGPVLDAHGPLVEITSSNSFSQTFVSSYEGVLASVDLWVSNENPSVGPRSSLVVEVRRVADGLPSKEPALALMMAPGDSLSATPSRLSIPLNAEVMTQPGDALALVLRVEGPSDAKFGWMVNESGPYEDGAFYSAPSPSLGEWALFGPASLNAGFATHIWPRVCGGRRNVKCGVDWSFNTPAATDACGGTNVTLAILSTVTNGICPQVITRTWEATDACGNKSQCSQSVALIDKTPPVLVVPPNKTVRCGSNWSFGVPTATDACCGANVTITIVNTVTNGVCPQTITRTWRATDCCGNSVTGSQTVTATRLIIINDVDIVRDRIRFNIETEIGETYIIEYKSGLSDRAWTTLRSLTGAGRMEEVTDDMPMEASRFYRVRVAD